MTLPYFALTGSLRCIKRDKGTLTMDRGKPFLPNENLNLFYGLKAVYLWNKSGG